MLDFPVREYNPYRVKTVRALSVAVFTFFLILTALDRCNASEIILLKPTGFGFFFFSEAGRSFSLKEDRDHRSRIYKIEIFSPTKAHFYEQSDGGNYSLISDRCLQVGDDSYQLPGEKKRRTLSISFTSETGRARHFLIDISDTYSKFTSSLGDRFGDHIECGYVIDHK